MTEHPPKPGEDPSHGVADEQVELAEAGKDYHRHEQDDFEAAVDAAEHEAEAAVDETEHQADR